MAKTLVSSTSDGKHYGKLRQRDTALADVRVVCDVVIQSPPLPYATLTNYEAKLGCCMPASLTALAA
jgi:hypothetical protein